MGQNVNRGLASVEESAGRMQTVHGFTSEIDTAVEKLANGMKQIREILTSIQGIANQTNMLALNASIEAARAGDAGRGFQVVAQQVRVLADQSKQAAEEILGFTKMIEQEADQAVKATRQGKQEVEQSVKAAEQAKTMIRDVHTGIESNQQYGTNMVEVIEEWANQVQQTDQELVSVKEVSRETLVSAKHVQIIVEDQLLEVEHLQEASLTLVEIMNQLDEKRLHFSI